jgi:DNA-binding NarL/FixJ family response regulator
MSDRQNVILEMLSRGMTNAKIAEKIGYSESLIRQETIAIYRNLGVSGRAELISSAG